MLCQPLAMFPVECVARGYLTGSGLVEYTRLRRGVRRRAARRPRRRLAAARADLHPGHEGRARRATTRTSTSTRWWPRSAPTTPSELRRLTLAVYGRAEEIARERGIILADTKFEFGRPRRRPGASILLADEVLTPDSSRFWPADGWQPGRPGAAVVRQAVRARLADLPASGWDRTGDQPPPPLPDEVVERTRALLRRGLRAPHRPELGLTRPTRRRARWVRPRVPRHPDHRRARSAPHAAGNAHPAHRRWRGMRGLDTGHGGGRPWSGRPPRWCVFGCVAVTPMRRSSPRPLRRRRPRGPACAGSTSG